MYIQLRAWTNYRVLDNQIIMEGDVHSFGDHCYGIHLNKEEIQKLLPNSALNQIIDDCNYHRLAKFTEAQVPKSLHSIWINLDDLKLKREEPRFVLSRRDPNEEIARKEAEQKQALLQEYTKIEKYGEF